MGGRWSSSSKQKEERLASLALALEKEKEDEKEERRLHHITVRKAMFNRLTKEPTQLNYPPLEKEVADLNYLRDFHHPDPVDETSSEDSVPEENLNSKRPPVRTKDNTDVKSAAAKIPLEAILKNINNNNPNAEPYYGVHPFLTKSKPMPVTQTKPSLVVSPPNSERPIQKRVDERALVKNVLPKSILKKDRGAMSKDRYPLRRPRKDITGLTKSKPEHNRHKGVKASKLPLAVSRPVEVNTSLPWNKKSNLKEAEVPTRILNTETVRNFKILVPPLEETMQENLVLPPSRSQSTENLKVTASPSLESLREFAAAFTLKMKNLKVTEKPMKHLKTGSDPKASLCDTEVPTWDWNTMEPLKIIVQPRGDLDEGQSSKVEKPSRLKRKTIQPLQTSEPVGGDFEVKEPLKIIVLPCGDLNEVQSSKVKEPSRGERENILPLQLSESVAGDLNWLRSLEVKDFKLPLRGRTVGNFNTSTLVLDEKNNTSCRMVAKPSREVMAIDIETIDSETIHLSDVPKKGKDKSRRRSKKKSKAENPTSDKSSRTWSPSTPAAMMIIDETSFPLYVFPGLPRLEVKNVKEPPRSDTLDKFHTSTLILDEENNKTFRAIVKPPREVMTIDNETIQASDDDPKKGNDKSQRRFKMAANPVMDQSSCPMSPPTPAALMITDEESFPFPLLAFPELQRLVVKPSCSDTLEKFQTSTLILDAESNTTFGTIAKPREVIDSETIQASEIPKKAQDKSQRRPKKRSKAANPISDQSSRAMCPPTTAATKKTDDKKSFLLSVFPELKKLDVKDVEKPPRRDAMEKFHTSTLILDEENKKPFAKSPREVMPIQASDVSKKSRRRSKKKSKALNPFSDKSSRAWSPSSPAAKKKAHEKSSPLFVFTGTVDTQNLARSRNEKTVKSTRSRSQFLQKLDGAESAESKPFRSILKKPSLERDKEDNNLSVAYPYADFPIVTPWEYQVRGPCPSRASLITPPFAGTSQGFEVTGIHPSNNNVPTSGENRQGHEPRTTYSSMFFNNYEPASCIKLNEEVNYPVHMIPRNAYGEGRRRVAFSSPLTEGRYIYTPVIEIESNTKVIENEIKAKTKAKRTRRTMAARRQQDACARLAEPKTREDGVLHYLAFDRYHYPK